jgi:SWIM zinc finger
MTPTSDSVLALAPDAASAKAARGLASPSQWPTLGANEKAVWGECQGSGAKPYQTQVDREGPAFRCSCPSRKFPCKHGLALLLMHADAPARFSAAECPAWVSDWLASRADKAEKKEEKQRTDAAKPIDPESVARSTAQRWSRIEAATNDLQRWLCDQIERGLGTLTAQHRPEWETIAARLVDAQAPGLASRVREAAACLGDRSLPPETLLQRLGILELACNAIKRRDQLSAESLADTRVLVGWPLEKADVIAMATPIADRWIVIGQASEERDGKLTERRVWLHGEGTGRRALLLDHAFGGKGFERAWLNGTAVETALAFYPSAAALRAIPASAEYQISASVLPAGNFDAEWQQIAQRIAACPWVPLHPILCRDAVPRRVDEQNWIYVADQRMPLTISDTDWWSLLTLSGGHPIHVMCEWNGHTLCALAAESPDGKWQRAVA